MMEPVAYLREAGFRSLAEGCHTSAMPTDVDEYNIPVVRVSDAEARIRELERDLRIAIEQRNMTLTEMQGQMDRAEAAEALLKEAGEALDGMLQYAGIIEERCGNVETVLARRAARAIHDKIGVKDE